MTHRFDLGPGAPCDLDVLVDTRLLIQANSGGGKSWALRRILEQTHGKIQQLVIDPEGEFSTLRERGDYVLAARQHGDTVADPRSAKLLAERLLELGVSAVLDIYELKAHDRIRFVRAFLEALVDAPKKLWHPVLIVVDEVHVYCPEKGEAESAGAVIDLATRGRKRGFCAIFATQRLSKLHKDAAAECNNKLIGRTSLDIDMKRAADELGITGREEMHKLRILEPGEFLAFGPAIASVVKRLAIGEVKTTHPKAGARIAFTPPPPTAKVKALLPQLSDLPKEAEDRQKSLEDVKRELATVRGQLTIAQRGAPIAPPKEVVREKIVEKPVITEAQLGRIEKLSLALGAAEVKAFGVVEAAQERWREVAAAIKELSAVARAINGAEMNRKVAPPMARELARSTPRPATTSRPAGTGHGTETGTHLGRGERAVLTAIAQHDDGVTREQLTVLTGYKRSSRDTYLQKLFAASCTISKGERIWASDIGLAVLGPGFQPLPTGDALREHWLRTLGGGERRILETLCASYPNAVTKDAISAQTGYKRSSRDTYLQKLSSRRLIESPESGSVRAAELLFG